MKNSQAQNIFYASFGNLIPAIMTYLFWFIAAKIAGPEAIGITSVIMSFSLIIVTIDLLDSNLGMKRRLGISWAGRNINEFGKIVSTVVIFVSILLILSIIPLITFQEHISDFFKIQKEYYVFSILFIPSMIFYTIFSEVLVSALKSKKLIIPLIIAAVIRFPIFFILMFTISEPVIATILSYLSMPTFAAISFLIYTIKFTGIRTMTYQVQITKNIKQLIIPSLSSWVPHIISVLGSQLGIITVFVISGSLAGGLFYIPFAIYQASLFIVSAITRVSHAFVASIETLEKQNSYFRDLLRNGFLFTMPVAAVLMFFGGDFLNLMGKEYSTATDTLIVLTSVIPLTIITEITYFFMFGKGDHKAVLQLGLVGNIPRIILYFVLVPIIGGFGAAIAILIGTAAQLIISLIIIKKHSFSLDYKNYFTSIIIPILLASIMFFVGLHFVLATFLIIFGTFLIYAQVGLFTKRDLKNKLNIVLTSEQAEIVFSKLVFLFRKD